MVLMEGEIVDVFFFVEVVEGEVIVVVVIE